jgi:hypothetical protein
VPTQRGPDLHRDKLGLADDADRQAVRDLRIVAPIVVLIGIAALIAGAGPVALPATVTLIAGFLGWRSAFLRRKARRAYAQRAQDPS